MKLNILVVCAIIAGILIGLSEIRINNKTLQIEEELGTYKDLHKFRNEYDFKNITHIYRLIVGECEQNAITCNLN